MAMRINVAALLYGEKAGRIYSALVSETGREWYVVTDEDCDGCEHKGSRGEEFADNCFDCKRAYPDHYMPMEVE